MQQRDQTVLQVVTPGDIRPVQNQTDVEKSNSDGNNGHNKFVDIEEPDKKTFFHKFGGMLMALSASFFFSISFLIVKILGNHGFKAFGCSVLFNVGVIIPCIFGILLHEIGPGSKERSRIFREIWPLSVSQKKTTLFILLVSSTAVFCASDVEKLIIHFIQLQGTLQGLSVIFRSFSLRYMSIGDMTVIVFSSPVVTNFIAHFLVGEPCGFFFVFTAILTLCGVGMITKPPFLTGATTFDYNTTVSINKP